MALIYPNVIITAALTGDKGDPEIEANESWHRLRIHAVPLVRYMGKGTADLLEIGEATEEENEGIAIPAEVPFLTNRRTIRERRLTREIAASSIVFVAKGSKAVQFLMKNGIKAAGGWYRVEAFTNTCSDRSCEICCGWGHIERKWNSEPRSGYSPGHQWRSNHKCNVVGCTAKQESLCGHTL